MKLKDFKLKYQNYFSSEYIENGATVLKKLTVKLDNSREGDVVFYFIRDDSKSEAILKERLKSSECSLLIVNKECFSIKGKNVFVAGNFEKFKEMLVNDFYPILKEKRLVGITGTNGKSTVVHLCRELARVKKLKAISIGTLGVIDSDSQQLEDLGMTSPSFVDIRRLLYQYKDNYEFAFFEVSSHALDQERFKGLDFECIAWTSFSQDHLDYHESEENYFKAKAKILLLCKKGKLLIPFNHNLIRLIEENKIEYEIAQTKLKVPLLFQGGHNKENLELSLLVMSKLGINYKETELKRLDPPEGRFQYFNKKNKHLIVDYAHTPDAIKNILISTRETFPEKKVLLVFGCGGDRDPSKRKMMGNAAVEGADRVIVTSDNPRFEDPNKIIEDIINGQKSSKIEAIVSRKEAIEKAVEMIDDSWIAIIAGKGHEGYQEIKGKKFNFSDLDTIKSFIGG